MVPPALLEPVTLRWKVKRAYLKGLFKSYRAIMEIHGGWNPLEGRRYSTIKDYGGDRESKNKLDHRRVAAVIIALAAIGIAIYLLTGHSSILQGAKSLVLSIWDMLCTIANAFMDFIEYVKHQRSS